MAPEEFSFGVTGLKLLRVTGWRLERQSKNLTWPLNQKRSESRGSNVGCSVVPVAVPHDPKAAGQLPGTSLRLLFNLSRAASESASLAPPLAAECLPSPRVQDPDFGQGEEGRLQETVLPEARVCGEWALGCSRDQRHGQGGKGLWVKWGSDPTRTAFSVLSHWLWCSGKPDSPVSSSLQDSIKLPNNSHFFLMTEESNFLGGSFLLGVWKFLFPKMCFRGYTFHGCSLFFRNLLPLPLHDRAFLGFSLGHFISAFPGRLSLTGPPVRIRVGWSHFTGATWPWDSRGLAGHLLEKSLSPLPTSPFFIRCVLHP